MKKLFSGFDWTLFLAGLFLSILGLVSLGSVAPSFFCQQLIYLLLGLVLLVVFSQIDYRIFGKFAWLIFIGSILFLLTPLLFGAVTRGSVRWIQIGPFNFQPSELVKPFLIIFFASFFETGKNLKLKRVILGGLLLVLPVFLIFYQPDLGSSLVVLISWAGIVFTAGVSWQLVAMATASLAIFLPLIWKFFLINYQRQRIFAFLNPLKDTLGLGYNLIQATVAIGSGQFLGRGWGRGTQSHLRFLPERHTDFIFASLAEEFGFLGGGILILLLGILLWRILVVSQKSREELGTLIGAGVFMMIFGQTLINIGMNLGLLPITGIPLPLISYGGSSLITTMISLGILENISQLKKREETIIIGTHV